MTNKQEKYKELQEHHGKIVEAYSIQRNKTILYNSVLKDIKKILECAKKGNCDNCPKLEWCEENCDSTDNLIWVLEEHIKDFEDR